jgi:hypothetical protein
MNQVRVQAFRPELTVEAFDKAVLHGLAGRDLLPHDLPVFLPLQYGTRRKFGPSRHCPQTMYGWPLGKSFVWVLHSSRSRPCIRHLFAARWLCEPRRVRAILECQRAAL